MWSLFFASCAVAYAAFRCGRLEPLELSVVGLLGACAAAVYGVGRRGRLRAPACRGWIQWPLLLSAVYVLFQLIPLPLEWLRVLSPGRAAVVLGANTVLSTSVRFAPLSVTPGAAVPHLITLCTCILLLLLIRKLAWEYGPWKVLAPVIAIALTEALFGLVQSYFLGAGEARGTWANRNHFANFEAMCLPFPAAFAISMWQQRSRGKASRRSTWLVLLASCVFVTLLVAIVKSLSRMGFASAIFSVAILAALVAAFNFNPWRHTAVRWNVPVLSIFLGVLLSAFFLAPPELILRYGKLEFSDGISTQDRLLLWDESLPLVSAFPAFGTGLGGYESAFLKHKVTYPLVRDAFAHNDYLQYLIELGIAGFSLILAAAVAVVCQTARNFIDFRGDIRAASAACLGAFGAILVHSMVDFSLYIPVNCLLLAWIAGVACSPGPQGLQPEIIFSKNARAVFHPSGIFNDAATASR
jgi:O-antigen ligase